MNLVQQRHHQARLLTKHLSIVALLLVILYPILCIILMSFNPNASLNASAFPRELSLVHWKYILSIPYTDPVSGEIVTSPFPIALWLWNSLKIAFSASFLMLFLSTTAAYALSRFPFKGRNASLLTLMLIQMFPSIMAMVAFYLMLDKMGDVAPALGTDTHLGLILVYLGGTPFNIWLIKGYFDTIPKSIEEAAIMDGCTRFQAFLKIVLPLSSPILAVVGLLTFIGTFSDFILPSILLKSQDKLTFAVGIQIFVSESFSSRWGQFAAACVLGSIPISIVFYSIHKYIVSGLSMGGVKG